MGGFEFLKKHRKEAALIGAAAAIVGIDQVAEHHTPDAKIEKATEAASMPSAETPISQATHSSDAAPKPPTFVVTQDDIAADLNRPTNDLH